MEQPAVVVVSGLAGAGKTTLARAGASELGLLVISTDAVRLEPFGSEKRPAGFEQGAYRSEARQQTYDRLFARAEKPLAQGTSVALDGTFLDGAHLERAQTAAANRRASFRLIECVLPDEAVRYRMEQRVSRGAGLSDATYEIYLRQKAGQATRPASTFRVDTQADIVTSARTVADWLRSPSAPPQA